VSGSYDFNGIAGFNLMTEKESVMPRNGEKMDNNMFGKPEENDYEEKKTASETGGPQADTDVENIQTKQTEQYYSGSTPRYSGSFENMNNRNDQSEFSPEYDSTGGRETSSSGYDSTNGQSAYSSGDDSTNGQTVYSSGYEGANGQTVYSSGYEGANSQTVYSSGYEGANGQTVYSSGYEGTNGQTVYSSGYEGANGQSIYSSGYDGTNGQGAYSSGYDGTKSQNVYTSGYDSKNGSNIYTSTYENQNKQDGSSGYYMGSQNAQNTYSYGYRNTQNSYGTQNAQNPYAAQAYGQNNTGYQGYQPEMEEPVKMGDWLLLQCLLSFIPCVGLILAIVWAFSKTEKQSKVNFCKAYLIVVLIRLAVVFVLIILYGSIIIAAMEGAF